jgi:hypothetical protein
VWLLELLGFMLGVAAPLVFSQWLERRYYQHELFEGNTPYERIMFGLKVLAGEQELPKHGFMSLKDRPISLAMKGVGVTLLVLSLLSVLYGLHFFAGIGEWFDHWIWWIPVYLVYCGAFVILLIAFMHSIAGEPKGDLKEFPTIMAYLHWFLVLVLSFLFSFTGLFASDFLGWTQSLAEANLVLTGLLGLAFLGFGGFSGWKAFNEEQRAKKIAHRLSIINGAAQRRATNLAGLVARLQTNNVAPKFIKELERVVQVQFETRRTRLLQDLNGETLPDLQRVNQTASNRVPSVREVLLYYWTPLGRPKTDSEFTAWEAYLLEIAVVETEGTVKQQRQAMEKAQRRVLRPMKADFEVIYATAETVERVRTLVKLWDKHADFPEVFERVAAGEDEEFVLIDLGHYQE